jgi:hypothetical protein
VAGDGDPDLFSHDDWPLLLVQNIFYFRFGNRVAGRDIKSPRQIKNSL